MITADQLVRDLGHIQIGGTTCRYTPEVCAQLAPLMNRVVELKAQNNAVLLAHSYVSPEILYVADFVGDSYELSKRAQASGADTIVFAAVKFMAQTAKILSPMKQVLIPSRNNGCSLADSISAEQVLELREQYPDFTFVCYINTTAEVKALCDVCVTSSNCEAIVRDIPNDKIYFLPDKFMAQNIQNALVAQGIHKTIHWWDGTCYVHETYDEEMIRYLRLQYPGTKVVSHPECSADVLSVSDFVGSTSQMIRYVETHPAESYVMLTECGLASRMQMAHPDVKFVGSCTMCQYMKANTLADIVRVLEHPEPQDIVQLDPAVITNAKRCIDAMFGYVGQLKSTL